MLVQQAEQSRRTHASLILQVLNNENGNVTVRLDSGPGKGKGVFAGQASCFVPATCCQNHFCQL